MSIFDVLRREIPPNHFGIIYAKHFEFTIKSTRRTRANAAAVSVPVAAFNPADSETLTQDHAESFFTDLNFFNFELKFFGFFSKQQQEKLLIRLCFYLHLILSNIYCDGCGIPTQKEIKAE